MRARVCAKSWSNLIGALKNVCVTERRPYKIIVFCGKLATDYACT